MHFLWWLWTRNAEEKDKAKFKARLWMPPKGVAVEDKRSPWAPENESAAFGSLQASLGLKSPAPVTPDREVRRPGRPAT